MHTGRAQTDWDTRSIHCWRKLVSRVFRRKVRFSSTMAQLKCARCGTDGAQLAAPPLPSDLGNRIYDSICQSCWDEWLKQQTAIINHYGLNLLQADARKFLTVQTEAFFFGPSEG
jgi:Fe-S cluster biosynthesis and repair protein YggX